MKNYLSGINLGFDQESFSSLDTALGTRKVLPENSELFDQLLTLTQTRFMAINTFFAERLKKTCLVVGNPPITGIAALLSARSDLEPRFVGDGIVWVYLHYDPKRLLALKPERDLIGALGVDFVKLAIDRLIENPPVSIEDRIDLHRTLTDICDQFREADYTWTKTIVTRDIPGTKMKGRIDVHLDGAETRRTLTALHRGKELFTADIGKTGAGAWAQANNFYAFLRGGAKIIFHPQAPFMLEMLEKAPRKGPLDPLFYPVEIELTDYPEAYAYIVGKGLLDAGPVV